MAELIELGVGAPSRDGGSGFSSSTSRRVVVALALTVLALLGAAAISLATQDPIDGACVRVRFPVGASNAEAASFAEGIALSRRTELTAWRYEEGVLSLDFEQMSDAADLQEAVDGTPIFVAGLGLSNATQLHAAVVDCALVTDFEPGR